LTKTALESAKQVSGRYMVPLI